LLGITVALAAVAVIAVIKWKSATAPDKFKFDRAKIYKRKINRHKNAGAEVLRLPKAFASALTFVRSSLKKGRF